MNAEKGREVLCSPLNDINRENKFTELGQVAISNCFAFLQFMRKSFSSLLLQSERKFGLNTRNCDMAFHHYFS